jgi:hypothetical protein
VILFPNNSAPFRSLHNFSAMRRAGSFFREPNVRCRLGKNIFAGKLAADGVWQEKISKTNTSAAADRA